MRLHMPYHLPADEQPDLYSKGGIYDQAHPCSFTCSLLRDSDCAASNEGSSGHSTCIVLHPEANPDHRRAPALSRAGVLLDPDEYHHGNVAGEVVVRLVRGDVHYTERQRVKALQQKASRDLGNRLRPRRVLRLGFHPRKLA